MFLWFTRPFLMRILRLVFGRTELSGDGMSQQVSDLLQSELRLSGVKTIVLCIHNIKSNWTGRGVACMEYWPIKSCIQVRVNSYNCIWKFGKNTLSQFWNLGKHSRKYHFFLRSVWQWYSSEFKNCWQDKAIDTKLQILMKWEFERLE